MIPRILVLSTEFSILSPIESGTVELKVEMTRYQVHVSKYICIHVYIFLYNQCSGMADSLRDKTLTLRKIYEYASELRNFLKLPIL